MEQELKQKIRPIYGELQGFLREAPNIGEYGNADTYDKTLWEM